MKENLIIENFGGIDNINISINKINIFIGPQVTGKSICAKLLFFFKKFDTEFINAIENEISKMELDERLTSKFYEYFPIHTYPKKKFLLRYEINDYFIEIKGNGEKEIELIYSEEYKNIFNEFKQNYKKNKSNFADIDKFELYKSYNEMKKKYLAMLKDKIGENAGFSQLFIPAGRSFFANLQKSIFSILSNNKSIDPFIIEFGAFYEMIKDIYQIPLGKARENNSIIPDLILEKILSGKYYQEKGNDFLIHPDGRKINMAYSSSGQQETLPLILILKSFLNLKFIYNDATIYIEEPETHIFPNAQKLIVDLISYVFNKSKFQFVITTHSPYILTSFNNLIQAGFIQSKMGNKKLDNLYKIISKELILEPHSINAYSLNHENFCDLINPETGLILAENLDSVSNEISIEFDKLLEMI